jgi:hypothetical protein
MTPQEFISKWGPGGPGYELNERQGAQAHFIDLCQLLGVPPPGSAEGYLFEVQSDVIGGKKGYADVFKRGVFAWENKAPGKNLDAALKQLLNYSLAMSNPPILVVSDRLIIRIHIQFTGYPSQTYSVQLDQLDQPEKLALLRRIWNAPESFKPKVTNRDITEVAAKSFATLAEGLRRRGVAVGQHADQSPGSQIVANQVAHFLTQCVFCFFAEDVGLLPGRMFERLVNNRHITPAKLTQGLRDLLQVMADGGLYGADDIPWFNGGLFKTIDVPELDMPDVVELRNAADLNWSAIDVSIFGTLFERGLDPDKRSQLGAHYTDTETIDRLIDPVLRRPLMQKWELVRQTIQTLMARSKQSRRGAYSAGGRHFKASAGDAFFQKSEQEFADWLHFLKHYRALDPACGSGNFLFLALKCLKDIELRSHLEAADLGLDRQTDLVTGPHNVLGIELNEYAAELARVTVWIGELQWRMTHGLEFKRDPVLSQLDHIECRDALLSFTEPGPRAGQTPGAHTLRFLKSPPTSAPPTPLDSGLQVDVGEPDSAKTGSVKPGVREATWPRANVVIGNPPFLGGSKKRRELGDDYFKALDTVFAGRVPGGADLVCYWFDKARVAIESNELTAAGLVATQSIRAGSNRAVLTAICATSKIVDAWSDESWVNDGAAVRVSLICFSAIVPEQADLQNVMLNGQHVAAIHADLTSGDGLNLTEAHPLPANGAAAFKGAEKSGPFEIDGALARQWLSAPNPHGRSNADVLLPWRNGSDIADRPKDHWVIDYGVCTSLVDAALYQDPFSHVTLHVKPEREKNNDRGRRENWWRFGRNGADMRQGVKGLTRCVVTPRVAKYRYFSWLSVSVSPDSRLLIVARADDTTFGILGSRMHEVWSLAQASMHGVGNDPTYNAKSCFETFPFPSGLTPADTAHQQTEPLESGALIPAHLKEQPLKAGVVRMSGAILRSEAYEPPASEPLPPGQERQSLNLRNNAIAIANAAKKLNDLRDNWLNPPEWTHKVPEVTPLGMDKSPYPDRIEPKPGISEQDLKALQKRTLTNLYNAKPTWLTMAHQQLDLAVAAAYGWVDYTPAMPDDEILKRLLALNLARSAIISGTTHPQTP